MRIVAGPLAGVDAIYAGMDANERELVLIDILGAARQVALAGGRLAAP